MPTRWVDGRHEPTRPARLLGLLRPWLRKRRAADCERETERCVLRRRGWGVTSARGSDRT